MNKPTPKQITRAFILSQKGKYSPALLGKFAVAAKALCNRKESWNFNTYLAMIPPNAKLVDLYFQWLRVIKDERQVKHYTGNWSFNSYGWLSEYETRQVKQSIQAKS